jgi:hypothetical protein
MIYNYICNIINLIQKSKLFLFKNLCKRFCFLCISYDFSICLSFNFKLTNKLSKISAINRCFSVTEYFFFPINVINCSKCLTYCVGAFLRILDFIYMNNIISMFFSESNFFAIFADSDNISPYFIVHDKSGGGSIGGIAPPAVWCTRCIRTLFYFFLIFSTKSCNIFQW